MDPKKAFNLQQLKDFKDNGGFPSSWTSYVKNLYQYEGEDLKIKDDDQSEQIIDLGRRVLQCRNWSYLFKSAIFFSDSSVFAAFI